MPGMTLLCRNATTFSQENELDEEAFQGFLQRFIDAKLGVYLASGGSGEGHALSRDELRRVYQIGVDVCKGKVQVNANPPEQHTPQAMIEHAQIAVDAGVDVVNIYGPTTAHGFRPSDAEFAAYFDEVLKSIRYPVALAPNPVIGYTPSAALIADLCGRYSQIVSVNLSGLTDAYYIDLVSAQKRDVEIYVPLPGSLHTLTLGATGLLSAFANIVPKTHRLYIDLYESGDFAALALVYADLQRFEHYVSKWRGARWIKMAMKVFKLPGGEGGLRQPYLMPADDEVEKFTNGLLSLHLQEVDEMAAAAGLTLPA